MEYTFEIVGVSPLLAFFTYQHQTQPNPRGAEYLATSRCSLDAFLESLETMPTRQRWNLDQAVESVIHFWLNHPEEVHHWQRQLEDAGTENLLIARLADLNALRVEFEALLNLPS